jgi:hypothetical protein
MQRRTVSVENGHLADRETCWGDRGLPGFEMDGTFPGSRLNTGFDMKYTEPSSSVIGLLGY